MSSFCDTKAALVLKARAKGLKIHAGLSAVVIKSLLTGKPDYNRKARTLLGRLRSQGY